IIALFRATTVRTRAGSAARFGQRPFYRARPVMPRDSGLAIIPAPQRPTAHDWMWAQIPDPGFLLGEVFSTTSRGLLSASTGLGKTMLCMALGLAMSEGRDFLHWQAGRVGPSKVLYVDGEMSERLMKRRFTDALRRAGFDPGSAAEWS